ncbi:MAG TPA: hypothetical protein VGK10_01040 [Prolixibacteraceae bacterium]|jgi:hypothetical protein
MDKYSYIKLIKQLPQPTPLQIDKFIELLSINHSWYKHLSQNRSHDFVIFLDPNAGRSFRNISKVSIIDTDHILKEAVFCDFIDIDKDEEGSNYQNSKGFWSYFITEGITEPLDPIKENEGRHDSRPYLALNIVDDSGLIRPIPDELIEKCTIKLSRYLHDCYSLENSNGFDDEGVPPNIYIQKHEEIIKDLKSHMLSIVDMIYR